MAAPGLAGWQHQILKGIGAPVTPQNLQFLDAWTRAEGGGATNNPFNTTQSVPGASAYNSVGVRNYGSPDVGIRATIQTLLNGRYGNIIGALKQGNDPMAAANALAASPWGTGSLVQKILGGGGSVPKGSGTPAFSELPAASGTPSFQEMPLPARPTRSNDFMPLMQMPDFSKAVLGSIGKSSDALTNSLIKTASAVPKASPLPSFQSLGMPSFDSPDSAPQLPVPKGSGLPVGKTNIGDPIPGKYQTSVGGEHETAGLAGFPARDYFAKPGSPAVAPVSGKIVKLSGHDPSMGPIDGPHGPLGWSVYLQGDDGRTYYMTHMGSRNVAVGMTVKAGQELGTVADYDKYGTPSHIHMGVS